MCGLAGEFVTRGERALHAPELFDMIDILAHRGPESAGYWLNEEKSAMLMHARLALVDLERGRQPLADESGRLWLSLNGELYGHRSARTGLMAKGHRFRSECDAEIVPHLYQDHGADCFEMLDGEFAFALFDQSKRELFLVRDRFGVKPLFYTVTKDSVVFGSEAKSVLSHPGVSASLDRQSLLQSMLALGLPDQTWMKDIRQVKPGHFLRISHEKVEEKPYWTLRFRVRNESRTIGEAADQFRSLLDEAVRLRLDADVEIGSYLSGGLDSSAIAESMVRQAPYTVKTFSIRYSDDRHDESTTAAETARLLGAQNIQVDIGDAALADSFIPSIWHSEQIAPNSHGAAKYLLSAETGKHVKAVMTGEGSDELFAGYGFFTHQCQIEAGRARQQGGDREPTLSQAAALAPGIVPVEDYRKYDLVTGLYGQYPYQALRAIAAEKMLGRLLSRDFTAETDLGEVLQRHAEWISRKAMQGLEATRASQYAWIKSDFPAYLLANLGDRPEMANSVEGRVPFLDAGMVEFALGLPMNWLVDRRNGKLIIRRAMKGVLPASITEPKKNFFWTPARNETALLQNPVCTDYLTRAAAKSAGIFDPDRLDILARRLRALPAGSNLANALRSLLLTAASAHILLDLFVGNFKQSSSILANNNRRWVKIDLGSQEPQRI